ncbi:hypothetical protein ACU3L3_07390 [Priestia endophytica]
MKCEEKPTGKYNKNGTEKMLRKYFHSSCYEEYLRDKAFKEKEMQELEKLYDYILKLHNIEALDGRMMEKVQDLRNGSIKYQGKKIKRYKNGVTYTGMLLTYQHLESTIQRILDSMHFEEKWNEFSYIFGTMVRGIEDAKVAYKRELKEKKIHEQRIKTTDTSLLEDRKTVVHVPVNKEDELDISSFL